MKQILQTLLEKLLDNPQKIKIEEEDDGANVRLKLEVAKVDMGKVIGKEGKVIQALRALLKIKAIKEGKRVDLTLVEPQ